MLEMTRKALFDGNPEVDGDGNPLYTINRHQIVLVKLRAGAMEYYHFK